MESSNRPFSLPTELISMIFSQLGVNDLLACSLVCKTWLNNISSDKNLCGRLTLKLTNENIFALHQHFMFKRPYHHLVLQEIDNLPKHFPWSNLHRIQHLHVNDCEFHWNLDVMALFTQSIKHLNSLQLCIGPTCGLESCLDQLNMLPNIISLTIVLKPNYKRDFSLNLDNLRGLEYFFLGYAAEQETPFLSHSRSNALKVQPGEQVLSNLKSFRISRIRVKAYTLQQIFRWLTSLEYLELANCCKGADWTELAKHEVLEESISNLRNLRILVIDDVVIENDKFLSKMELPRLEKIQLIKAENVPLSEFRDYIARTVKIQLLRKKCPNAAFE